MVNMYRHNKKRRRLLACSYLVPVVPNSFHSASLQLKKTTLLPRRPVSDHLSGVCVCLSNNNTNICFLMLGPGFPKVADRRNQTQDSGTKSYQTLWNGFLVDVGSILFPFRVPWYENRRRLMKYWICWGGKYVHEAENLHFTGREQWKHLGRRQAKRENV